MTNVPLAHYTTFGIGGPADYFYKAESAQDIIKAVQWANERQLPFFVLGSGANILVGDKGFRGLVIKNESKKMSLHDIFLTAESGITIAELIEITAENGLSGLEHFAGIPSTLGGALWQNLHFLSPDRSKTVFIGEIIENAEILICHPDRAARRVEGSVASENFFELDSSTSLRFARNDIRARKVNKDYFHFSYDYSILHDTKDIVLSATLRLTKEDPKIIQERIAANLAWRAEKHPENAVKTSAGSVFKKIKGYGAGRLIDKVGLKGYQIGGARISEKHANFIVNTG